jgi:hypothetical protein
MDMICVLCVCVCVCVYAWIGQSGVCRDKMMTFRDMKERSDGHDLCVVCVCVFVCLNCVLFVYVCVYVRGVPGQDDDVLGHEGKVR